MSQEELSLSQEIYAINDPDENRTFFQALDSFFQYSKVAHYNTTHVRRQIFYALPIEHRKLLASPPFSYQHILNHVDDAIDTNATLSLAIFKAGLDYFNIPDHFLDSWQNHATSGDIEKARSTLRQFFRDWSAEGSAERETCYGRVIQTLKAEKRSRSSEKLRVLVPGAGLSRLVFELCCAGIDTEGNEISYHQLLASYYILNVCPKAQAHVLFPWVHSFSNHRSRQCQMKSVQVPDEEFKETFDAIATVFFLDTAPNIIRYFETMKNCLRTGGLVVNFGPLLWHFESDITDDDKHTRMDENSESQGIADPGAVELTDDEVITLIETFGFRIETRENGILAPYIQDSESMLQHTYKASFWCARKL